MSADLLEDVDDERGASVCLSMKVSGDASLFIDSGPFFHLAPTDEGLKLAERIEQGLKAWREHVLRLREIMGP